MCALATVVETVLQVRGPGPAGQAFDLEQVLNAWFLIWKVKDLPYQPPRLVMRFKVYHIYKHAP